MSEKHILIAEDDQYVRISLSAILSKAGYGVSSVEDGQKAFLKITELRNTDNPVDLLLTDMRMPGISGIELIEKLEQADIMLPVLVITGYGNKKMLIDLMRKGCADYIDKPFQPHELLARLPPIFKKMEKEKAEKEKQNILFVHEKAELNRQLESYVHNLERLRAQMDSAVGAYQDLTYIREDGYKIRVAYLSQPLAELGGDLFDIRDTPAGCDLLVADVAGHDMGASYHSILIKAFFDENCRLGNDGESFFHLLNRQLLENGKNERMVTAIFLRLDLVRMEGEAISAGHPHLIRISGENLTPETVKTRGDVLGIHEEVHFETRKFLFAPGDRFFLHTDGLTNAYRLNDSTRQKMKIGTEGLMTLMEKYASFSLERMIRQIEDSLTPFHGYKFNDDTLLLGVEIP